MDKQSIIRTTVLVFALVNQVLASMGNSPLPFDEQEVEQGVSALITAGASLWAWWKNNYITSKGQKQKEVIELNNLK